MKVLVTVASRHGSTAAIATAVADVLAEAGLEVDRMDPADVASLDGYDAVVLGSAVYAGRWMGEATDLVERHEAALAQLPVWVLSSGPLGDPAEPAGPPPGPEELIGRLQPRDHRVFAGAIDRADLSLAERAIVKVVKAPYGDFRDWDAVRAWALSIADALRRPDIRPSSGTATTAP